MVKGNRVEYNRIRTFINSYAKDDMAELQQLYDEALSDGVPVIRREMRDFIRCIITAVRPAGILEIGTAVGYSALSMACMLQEMKIEFRIDTVELERKNADEAEKNFEKFSMNQKIFLHRGDAAVLLKEKKNFLEKYDLVLIDAAKAQYKIYMEEVIKMTDPGAVILTDNVFMDGEVLESHNLVKKRDRTIHDNMREYLYMIKNTDKLETSILAIGDGIAMSVRK